MILLKVIASVLTLVATLLKFGLDYWWRDKRTNTHKRARAFLVTTAILAGTSTAIIVLVDQLYASKVNAEGRQRLETIEHFTTGGLAPDIMVELYIGPNHPTPPRMTLNPEFPGLVVVWVDNNLDYPIYDLSVFMIHHTPQGRWSKTSETFNQPPKEFNLLRAGERRSFILPADLTYTPDRPLIGFEFLTHTKRGATRQSSRFYLVSNRWEHARQSIDLTTTNVLLNEVSPNYPRNSKGEPAW